MSGYCFDTDVLSATLRRDPPLHLIRRLARTPAREQFTTAVNAGELLYGAARKRSPELSTRVRELLEGSVGILPFDIEAAGVCSPLRAELEADGRRLAEPDLRIASIALAHDLVLVTGNVRHFQRITDLVVEDWLA